MALESHQAPWQYHTGRRADDVTFYRPEKRQALSCTSRGKLFVKDGRTAKERMAAGEKICAVTFTNQDALTVCCVLNSDGAKRKRLFVRGGAEYAHRCRQVTDKIKNPKHQEAVAAAQSPIHATG